MDYDKFQIGDKVWSEEHGFSMITGIGYKDGSPSSLEIDRFSRHNGNPIELRPGVPVPYIYKASSFFHAVADTDEGMRAAIARGAGLKRPVPRGRWEIQPGDRVMNKFGQIECCGTTKGGHSEEDAKVYPITAFGHMYSSSGFPRDYWCMPEIMRLYDGEEPFEDPCENMRWMMDEAVKFGWYEKYGK